MHFCSTLETVAVCSCATGYKLVEEVKCVPEGNLYPPSQNNDC